MGRSANTVGPAQSYLTEKTCYPARNHHSHRSASRAVGACDPASPWLPGRPASVSQICLRTADTPAPWPRSVHGVLRSCRAVDPCGVCLACPATMTDPRTVYADQLLKVFSQGMESVTQLLVVNVRLHSLYRCLPSHHFQCSGKRILPVSEAITVVEMVACGQCMVSSCDAVQKSQEVTLIQFHHLTCNRQSDHSCHHVSPVWSDAGTRTASRCP
jgi:hypothetical protein